MGFLGGNGTLPAHYTERIATHVLYQKDESPRAFLDTFSNRAVALFYQAWRKYRLEFKYALDEQDRFLPILLSLAGVGQTALQNKLSVNHPRGLATPQSVNSLLETDDAEASLGILDQSLGYYATALMQRPASASYMQGILSEYFAVPISIEQFVGCWYEMPIQQQTALGANNATLGEAMIGERAWQRDLRMRLVIGPLSATQFAHFLPQGQAALALKKMLTLFTNLSLEYEVQLILCKEAVKPTHLSAAHHGRLGWNSFLISNDANTDRRDVCYEIHTQ